MATTSNLPISAAVNRLQYTKHDAVPGRRSSLMSGSCGPLIYASSPFIYRVSSAVSDSPAVSVLRSVAIPAVLGENRWAVSGASPHNLSRSTPMSPHCRLVAALHQPASNLHRGERL